MAADDEELPVRQYTMCCDEELPPDARPEVCFVCGRRDPPIIQYWAAPRFGPGFSIGFGVDCVALGTWTDAERLEWAEDMREHPMVQWKRDT